MNHTSEWHDNATKHVNTYISDPEEKDQYKALVTACAFLADEEGIVQIADIEDHYGFPRGSVQRSWGDTTKFRLTIPDIQNA